MQENPNNSNAKGPKQQDNKTNARRTKQAKKTRLTNS